MKPTIKGDNYKNISDFRRWKIEVCELHNIVISVRGGALVAWYAKESCGNHCVVEFNRKKLFKYFRFLTGFNLWR